MNEQEKEKAAWMEEEKAVFKAATPAERASILRDVSTLAKSPFAETADWNSALLEYLKTQNLPAIPAKPAMQQPEPITWQEVRQVVGWTAKVATPPAVIIGGGYIAVAAIQGAATGIAVWLAANGAVIGGAIGIGGLLVAVSGLFGGGERAKRAEGEQATGGGPINANGEKVIIQHFHINGDGNTVVNKNEQCQ